MQVTTLRVEWVAQVPITDLQNAVTRKIAYHQKRLAFWEDQIAMIKEDLRTKGITISEVITERLIVGYSASNNANPFGAPSVKVDENMLKDLRDASMRRRANRASAREYSQWADFLAKIGEGISVNMTYSDHAYFFADIPEDETEQDDGA